MVKRVNPAAINALKEALSLIYWYKRDLRNFLIHALDHPELVGRFDWQDTYKRRIVDDLVELLARNQEQYLDDLLNLIMAVTDMEDFSHLEKLEDGQSKAERARRAVKALRALSQHYHDSLIDSQKRKRQREEYLRKSHEQALFTAKLEELYQRYKEMASSSEPQKRGYMLERLLWDLFDLFDLDPKASFKLQGEQIDGAFTFEGTDYLLEAKWQTKLVEAKDLDALAGKVKRKLDNTLGIFVAINGFSPDAVKLHSQGRPVLFLVDGVDLVAVLEKRIDLRDLLRRKRRHAAQTGNIFISVWEMHT